MFGPHVPLILPAIAWAAAIFMTPRYLRARADVRVASYTFGLILLAAALTMMTSPIAASTDHIMRLANAARWASNVLILVAAYETDRFIVATLSPEGGARRHQRRVQIWLVLAVIVMAYSLWYAGPTSPGINFETPTRSASLILYRVTYLAFFTYVAVRWIRACVRYGRVSPDAIVKLSMATTVVGGVWVMGYIALTLTLAAAPLLPVTMIFSVVVERGIGLCVFAAVVFVVAGSTLPAWGPRVGIPALLAHMWRAAACRRLAALWRVLLTAAPDAAFPLGVTWWSALIRQSDMELLLYRREVEILDSALALAPYMDSLPYNSDNIAADLAADRSHRKSDNSFRDLHALALADAHRLERALAHARERSEIPTPRGTYGPAMLYRPSTHDEQIRYLELVAHAFHVPERTNHKLEAPTISANWRRRVFSRYSVDSHLLLPRRMQRKEVHHDA